LGLIGCIGRRVENNHRARRRALRLTFAPHFCASLQLRAPPAPSYYVSGCTCTSSRVVTGPSQDSKWQIFVKFRPQPPPKTSHASARTRQICNLKSSRNCASQCRCAFFCASLSNPFCASPEPTLSTPLQIPPCFFLRLTKKLILATKVCNKGGGSCFRLSHTLLVFKTKRPGTGRKTCPSCPPSRWAGAFNPIPKDRDAWATTVQERARSQMQRAR
jgi:hypothetical protein